MRVVKAKAAPVPVIPGLPPAQENCAACKSDAHPRTRQVQERMDMTLCVDAVMCGKRSRRGVSHAQYAEALREGAV